MKSRDGVTDEVDEDEEDSAEMGQVDWVSQATQARESLVEADQSAQAQELHYKLLLEEARGNTATTAKQVSASMEKLTEHQRQLVKRSFSSLPPERDRQTVSSYVGLLYKLMIISKESVVVSHTYHHHLDFLGDVVSLHSRIYIFS
ncbi:hypothetical protein E2C01_077783 [Portunus trituberculatus]|uniref:Uncharacterized protein n=1 Tax=Portunus trituberculatus TaxID=210409 RepID=A0A5B7IGW9_PORTR|nr:hypothetical protein [Portunus trituberculatus]